MRCRSVCTPTHRCFHASTSPEAPTNPNQSPPAWSSFDTMLPRWRRLAPHLADELVDAILLRCPPDDPARLVRAALVCRQWRRVLADPDFPRRYRERHLHGSPRPLLGLFRRESRGTRFHGASSSSFHLRYAERRWVADARHGRVLFHDFASRELAVSNPFTGEDRALDLPPPVRDDCSRWAAALLCAAAGCDSDHLHCPRGGGFTVVLLATDDFYGSTAAHVYSSEVGAWSHVASIGQFVGYIRQQYNLGLQILEFDLGAQELSVIAPPSTDITGCVALTAAEDGGLGFVEMQQSRVYIWSREADLNGWAQRTVIELQSRLLACFPRSPPRVAAFGDGARVIFMWAYGVLSVDLKSGQVTEIIDKSVDFHIGSFPYISSCTPVLRTVSTSPCQEQRAGASSPQLQNSLPRANWFTGVVNNGHEPEGFAAFIAADGAGLGFVDVESKVHMRLRGAGPNEWVQHRFVDLLKFLPYCAYLTSPELAIFDDGGRVILKWDFCSGVLSSLDLKSGQVMKISNDCNFVAVPCKSFCLPAC
ncbi:hypothetical protein ACP4OV_021700 [Aristida adscensionis]